MPTAMDSFILHFGNRGDQGHHLTHPSGRTVRDFECDNMNIPRVHQLDGSHIFLPRPERHGLGALTYLPATDRTILAWWDRTLDSRPGCNMAVIATGNLTAEQIWKKFCGHFADLAPKLTMPQLAHGQKANSK